MEYKFLSFTLDSLHRELKSNGNPIILAPKAFSILLYLIENNDRMVSKRQLMDTFWSVNVSESALLKSISLIRKAVGQNKSSEPIVKTYHGVGYRFVAPIQSEDSEVSDTQLTTDLTEHRVVSIISVKLGDSCHLEPKQQSISNMEKRLENAKTIIEAHQGNLLHMMVDGFTANFGLIDLYDDVARRALNCAVELVKPEENIEVNNDAATISVGIDTGLILFDDAKDQQWKPPGDIERRASQLAENAKSGEVLLTQKTLDHLPNEVKVESYGEAFILMSPLFQRSGVPARLDKTPSVFVGRKAERAFLSECLNNSEFGNGSVVVLSGPAGIGKTRLVTEVLIKQQRKQYQQILINCLPSLQNSPLAPIRDLCHKLLSNLEQSNLSLSAVSEAILQELLEKTDAKNPILKELSTHQRRLESYLVIDTLITSACESSPLVLIIEDVHWLDATSVEYLNEIIRSLVDKRLMLVVTTRPVESHLQVESLLNIAPLANEDCREMLNSNESIGNLNSEMTEILISRSAGNPFFLEELAFATQSNLSNEHQIPDTVQAVITVRIGSLAKELRYLVYIIAVIGPPAKLELIFHLYGSDENTVYSLLEELIKKGFVIRDMDYYSLRHMLITDMAYSIISEVDRKKLHGQIADFLSAHADVNETRPEKIAWHYQESGNKQKAIPYWLIASRDALKQFNYNETVTFATKGLDLANGTSIEEKKVSLDFHLIMATALTTLHGFGFRGAGETYKKAHDLNNEVGDARSSFHVLVGLWIHNWVIGKLSESLSYAKKLMYLAEKSNHVLIQIQAHTSLGQVLTHMGRIEEAYEYLIKGVEYINKEPPKTLSDQNAATSCAAYAAWCASLMGNYDAAMRYYKLSDELSKMFKNPFALGIHYSLCSEYLLFIDDVDKCLELADKAILVSRKHNFSFWLGTGLVLRGWTLGQQGKLEQAFLALDEGIKVFKSTGAGVQMSNWFGLKAEIELKAGKLSEGLESVQYALNYADTTDDVHFKPRIHAVAAKLYQSMDDKSNSESHALQAKKLTKKFKFQNNISD